MAYLEAVVICVFLHVQRASIRQATAAPNKRWHLEMQVYCTLEFSSTRISPKHGGQNFHFIKIVAWFYGMALLQC